MRREGRTEIHRGDKATQARKRQETGPPGLEAQLGQRLHEARLCKQATSSPQACSKEGLVLVNAKQSPITRSRLRSHPLTRSWPCTRTRINLGNTGALPTHLVLVEESVTGKPDPRQVNACKSLPRSAPQRQTHV